MSPFQWRKKRRAHESSDIVYDEKVSDLKSPEPIARRFSAHFVWDIQQRTKFEHLKVRIHHLKPPSDAPILSIYGEKKPFRCDICSRNFSSEKILKLHITYIHKIVN